MKPISKLNYITKIQDLSIIAYFDCQILLNHSVEVDPKDESPYLNHNQQFLPSSVHPP